MVAGTRNRGDGKRPGHWAERLLLPGIPNLYRVSDFLYRSGQPSAEGMRVARAMGIRTVINLRSFHDDRAELGKTRLTYLHIAMKAWHPLDEDIIIFLKTVAQPRLRPVLVHCQYGSDRAGLMCAVYRVVVEGWSREEALDEMMNGGYGFHGMWTDLQEYILKLDVSRLKSRSLGDG